MVEIINVKLYHYNLIYLIYCNLSIFRLSVKKQYKQALYRFFFQVLLHIFVKGCSIKTGFPNPRHY